MSVTGNIIESYRAPRRVVRRLLDHGKREDRALAYLMIACLLIFVAQWPRLSREAHLSDEIPLTAMLSGALFGWLFVAPLVFYGLAAVLHGLQRLMGAPSSFWSARLVTFWALLAVTPLWLTHGLLVAFVGPGAVVQIFGFVALATYIGFVLAGLREAALEGDGATA